MLNLWMLNFVGGEKSFVLKLKKVIYVDHLSTNAQWGIIRQRAGPFVKAFSTDNRRFLRQCLCRNHAAPAMSGTSVDRLELRLALFGYDGVFYSLTFSNDNLPRDFSGVQRIWSCFLKRLKRW